MHHATPGSSRNQSGEVLPLMLEQRNSARVSKIKNDIRKVYKDYLAAKGKKPKNVQYFKDYCKKKRIKKANWSLCQSVMQELNDSELQNLPNLHFRVGSETKVFSPSKGLWNDGKVIKIKGKTFCVKIQYRGTSSVNSQNNSQKWVGIDQMAAADAEGSTHTETNRQPQSHSKPKAIYLPSNQSSQRSSPAKQNYVGNLPIGTRVEIHVNGHWVSGTATRVKKDSVRVAYGKDLAKERWVISDLRHFRVPAPSPSPHPPSTPLPKNIEMSPSMTPCSVTSSCASPFKPLPPYYPPQCARTAPSSPQRNHLRNPNKISVSKSPSKNNLIFRLFQSNSPSPKPPNYKKCKSADRFQAYAYPASVSKLRLDTGVRALSPPGAQWRQQTSSYTPTISAPASPRHRQQHLQISSGQSTVKRTRTNRKRGDLKIEVHGAMQLKRAANVATVNVAEYRLKTNTVSCTENPIWKETLIFNNFRPDIGKTGTITVFDKSSILGLTVVGVAEFRLLDSLNVNKKMTLDIKDSKGKLSGIVVIGQTVVGRRK